MGYTNNSNYLDAPQGNQQQWIALISAHQPRTTDDIADIVGKYFFHGQECGLNADLALGQACIESAYFTSDRWYRQRNPCGLNITSDDAPGTDFGTIDNGILAHYQHLFCYTMAADPPIMKVWPALDPRHFFFDNIPFIHTLEQPDMNEGSHRWAASGWNYVPNIVAVCNAALGEPIPISPPPPAPPVVFPIAEPNILKNDTNVNVWNSGDWAGRASYPVRAIVLHVMVGSYAGSISWFHNAAAKASANYCISYSGEITETVDPDTQAPWANGISNSSNTALPPGLADLRDGVPNANFVTVSIETEGGSPEEDGYPRAEEYASVVNMMAYLCKKYDLQPSSDTICRHTYFDTVNRPNCPGDHWDFNKLINDVTTAMNIPSPVDVNDPMGVESADHQYRVFNFVPGQPVIGHSIKTYWEKDGVNEGIWKYGYPLTSEVTEKKPDGSGVVCNWCERSRLEWHPEHQGTENEVQEGLIGEEMLLFYNRWSVLANGAIYHEAAGPERTTLAIDGRIQGYYDQHGGLRHFGYPLTEVVKYPGEDMQGQWFERAFIEIHEDGLIVGRRLGAEFLDQRKDPKGNTDNTVPEVS